MRTASLLLLVLSPAAVRADDAPALKVPSEVTAKPATITELKAETAGKVVRWVPLTPGLSLRPVDDGRTLLFAGGPGRYELLAYTAVGDVPSDPARVVITIEGVDPGPAPKTPDELRQRIAAALAKDKASKADVVQLAGIFREAVAVANDATVPSTKELLRRVREVSAKLLGTEALPNVRAAAAEEVLAALGMSNDDAITDAQRKRAAALYARLAEALEAASK